MLNDQTINRELHEESYNTIDLTVRFDIIHFFNKYQHVYGHDPPNYLCIIVPAEVLDISLEDIDLAKVRKMTIERNIDVPEHMYMTLSLQHIKHSEMKPSNTALWNRIGVRVRKIYDRLTFWSMFLIANNQISLDQKL